MPHNSHASARAYSGIGEPNSISIWTVAVLFSTAIQCNTVSSEKFTAFTIIGEVFVILLFQLKTN